MHITYCNVTAFQLSHPMDMEKDHGPHSLPLLLLFGIVKALARE